MRALITVLMLTISVYAFSQPYTGAHSSNYDPLKAQLFNPGLTSTSLIKWSVNVVGFDFHAAQDYLKLSGNLRDFDNFDQDENVVENLNGQDKSGNISFDAQLPSFMVNTPKAGAFSFYIRARTIIEMDDISEEFLTSMYNDANNIYNWASDFEDSELSFNAHAFAEVALGYSRSVFEKGNHALSVGATFKYLAGGVSAKLEGSVDIEVDTDAGTANFGSTDLSAISSDALDAIEDENYEWKTQGGFGMDIGAVYELKTGYGQTKIVGKNKDKVKIQPDYFIKAGVGFVDIGKIKYNHSMYSRRFMGDGTTVPLSVITEADSSFEDFNMVLEAMGDYEEFSGSYKTKLPTSMSLFADVKLTRGIYINASALVNIGSFKRDQPKARAQNIYSLTPRFELPAVGIYMPMAYNQLNGFEWGAGIRAGQFVIASSNIFSYLWNREATSVDIQFAVAFGAVDKTQKRAAKELLEEEDVRSVGERVMTPEYGTDTNDSTKGKKKDKKKDKKGDSDDEGLID